MKKKRKSSSQPANTKRKTTHIHFFYIIAVVWVAGTALAYHIVTVKDDAVLNASTQLARSNGVGEPGRSETDADGGYIEVGEIDSDGNVQIKINLNEGMEIEDDSSFKREKSKLKPRIKKWRELEERKASQAAMAENGSGGEQGRNLQGVKKTLVLPQPAVEALLKNGIITAVPVTGTTSATEDLNVVYTRVKGSPAFIIAGTKDEKLFGAIPVKVKKEVTVSAENGEVIDTKQTLIERILDFFSF